ncbi:D-alanine--D-alanine ligase family protein [Lactococcus reticulitermitis]|uniref:D-alanine--D-alanine ligase n=1 Tax=Pseudolactococcus reticulitermitis TaxID=2025039 RepID=A0A224WX61_9LACT|nr:ATP-grasp domain-containing protein [Lactococcus reticulitermitis]GAX46888.1 D-alanine--D-alanine ligase [Lactococcus reticulitermitis]
MNIIILYGGKSPEREVSQQSAKLIEDSLEKIGHKVISLELIGTYKINNNFDNLYNDYKRNPNFLSDKDYTREISKEVLKLCKLADIVFLATHGGIGEDGRLQALLEVEKILFTGNGFFSTAISMNKSVSKKIVVSNTVKVAKEYDKEIGGDNLPVIIKPNDSGSSIGVKLILEPLELQEIDQKEFLIEEFIRGREFSVGILGDLALPPIEIIVGEGIYDFQKKYVSNVVQEICPANISEKLCNKLMSSAIEVHKKLGFEVYSRIDFIVDDYDEIYFIEANSIPGMTPTSLLPKEAATIGINFLSLCDKIIKLSIEARRNKENNNDN